MMRKLALGERTSVQLTNLKKNGERFVNLLRIAPVRNEHSGKMVKYFGLLEDISRAAKLDAAASFSRV
jgi:PAS domain-containing protein